MDKTKLECRRWAAFEKSVARLDVKKAGLAEGFQILRQFGASISADGRRLMPSDRLGKEWDGWREAMMPYKGIIGQALAAARAAVPA